MIAMMGEMVWEMGAAWEVLISMNVMRGVRMVLLHPQ
jgi:hypothetical protein